MSCSHRKPPETFVQRYLENARIIFHPCPAFMPFDENSNIMQHHATSMKIHQSIIISCPGGAEWLVPVVSRCLERSQHLCSAAAGCGCRCGRPTRCREPLLAADVCSALGTPGGADLPKLPHEYPVISGYSSIHDLFGFVCIHNITCTYPIVTLLLINVTKV